MIRRIIRRMAEVKDMYTVVRFVGKSDVEDFMNDTIKTKREASLKFIETFQANFKAYILRSNFNRLVVTLGNAIEDCYLEYIGDSETGIFLNVSRKGSHLLGKRFYFFRVGLCSESLKQYDRVQSIVLAIIIALISALGGAIAGFIIK
jgi:hypothetical protein